MIPSSSLTVACISPFLRSRFLCFSFVSVMWGMTLSSLTSCLSPDDMVWYHTTICMVLYAWYGYHIIMVGGTGTTTIPPYTNTGTTGTIPWYSTTIPTTIPPDVDQACSTATPTARILHIHSSSQCVAHHDCAHIKICTNINCKPDRAGKDMHIFSKEPAKARSIAPPASVTLGGLDGHHNFCVIPPTLF